MMEAKPVSASRLTSFYAPLPADANNDWNMFGGHTMRLMDSAGFFSAMRHARRHIVTASATILFRSPIRMGEVFIMHSSVNAVWTSSMEVGIRAEAEDPLTGEKRHVCTAYLTFVGIDDDGRPQQLPQLVMETDEDRRRQADATRRMALSHLEEKRENAVMSALHLDVLPGEYAVCKLGKERMLPDLSSLPASAFFTITCTEEELSLLLDFEAAEALAKVFPEIDMFSGYRCLKVVESNTIHKIGMIASLTTLLASSQVPVLVVSSYSSAYVLVEDSMLTRVVTRLTSAGHTVRP